MSLVINTNTAATAASVNLNNNNSMLQKSLARLSSGSKITAPSDDAGGLAVSMRMEAAIRRTDATSTKLRLINGVTGSAGALTLTANNAPVGIGVQPAAASSYISIPGSANAMNLSLTSSLTPGVLYTTTNTLNANTVYSVLAGGDVAAPQLLIR